MSDESDPIEEYVNLRDTYEEMTTHLRELRAIKPASRELALAITKLQECRFWLDLDIQQRS